jgi:hypothetical protein
VETLGTNLATGGLQEQIESGDRSKETADTQQVDSSNDMDEDGQEDDYSSSDSNESFAVDQSSALQVETLGTNLATGGLQRQSESGDRSKETADTQQVNSSVEDEDGESTRATLRSGTSKDGKCYLQAPSATRQGVKGQVQRAPRGERARMWSC